MQQNNIEILCTRPLPEWLIDEAAGSGISIEAQSFIETEPVQSIEVQQEIENALLQSATVVFTSVNAVEAVAAELEGQQPDWNIYCTGAATRELAKEYFGGHAVAGAAPNAAELAELIAGESITDEVIFFCGDQRRDELPSVLKEHGIDINEIVVYQTIELPHKINKFYYGILFFSPSAVRSFFKVNKISEKTVLFAIGNTTAGEIKKFSANKIIVSDEPGKENIIQKVVEYFVP